MSAGANALAQAIAQSESANGQGFPGSNNPGNLKLGDIGYGTVDNGITVFPSLSAGVAALQQQAAGMLNGSSSLYSPNMTVAQAANLYSGGDPNAANNWASYLGVSPNDPLSTLNAGSADTNGITNYSYGGSGNSLSLGSVAGNPLQTAPQTGSPSGTGASGNPASTSSSGSGSGASLGIISSRLAAFIIGMILILAGVYSFKQTQSIIKFTGKGAELAA